MTDGCDFACFLLRRRTIERHGWFDAGYRPAYAEDNDYYTRVVLGGEDCRVVHAARFFHHGSMTIRSDTEATRPPCAALVREQYQTLSGQVGSGDHAGKPGRRISRLLPASLQRSGETAVGGGPIRRFLPCKRR